MIPLERLLAGPNPLPFIKITNPECTPTIRRTNCRHYNACLTLAHSRDWEGFHCNRCDSYSPYHPCYDFDGCATLVTELAKIASFDKADNEVIRILGLNREDMK